MRESNNNSLSIIVALFVAAGAFIWSWKFVLPEYQDTEQKINQTQISIENATQKGDKLTADKQALSDLGDAVDKISVSVSKDKDMPNTVTELESIATKNKTYIPSIQVTDSALVAGSSTSANNQLSIAFTVNGGFSDLQSFIHDLETDIKFFNISSMTLANSGKQMSLSLQLTAFKLPASTSPTALPETLPSTTGEN